MGKYNMREERNKAIVQLRKEGNTYRNIRDSMGVSYGVVSDVIRRAGLVEGKRSVVCKWCETTFSTDSDRAKFCDTKCRSNHNKTTYYSNPNNKTEHTKECNACKEVFTTKVRSYTCCSVRCSEKLTNSNRSFKRRVNINNGLHNKDITLDRLVEVDGYVCYLCNNKVDKEDYWYNSKGYYIAGNYHPSIDHITPLSKGGTHTWDNIKLAHRICNIMKSDNTTQEKTQLSLF